jgi:Ca2+-binding RTX toxin-like protein
MANMTAREQLMLELINRARMDPKGEAERLDVTLSAAQSKPVQVLAGNDVLRSSAYNHSGWMLLNNELSETETTGSEKFIAATSIERMHAYGYKLEGHYSYAENVSWIGEPTIPDFTQSILEQHASLFAGKGSRGRMLDEKFQEAGIGQQAGNFVDNGTTYVASMVTQDFIRSGTKTFITGVIYSDTVTANDFYDLGEGIASRKVSAKGAAADVSGTGGGYELQFKTTGITTMTFKQPGADLKLDVALGGTNVKVDAVNGHEIWTNGSVQSQSAAITELHALGIQSLVLIGSDIDEVITGNRGANQLLGLGGSDVIDGFAGKDTIVGGVGSDTLSGGAGADLFLYTARKDSKVIAPDLITDFRPDKDTIDLGALSSHKLGFAGTGDYTAVGQVRLSDYSDGVIVHINLDTDTGDEMAIVLDGVSLGTITKGDFIL